jgi:TatD DNase family protein
MPRSAATTCWRPWCPWPGTPKSGPGGRSAWTSTVCIPPGLPLIFHERDSGGRFLALLRTCPPPAGAAVIHCFSGNRAELTNYLDLGYYIGITGIVTLKERGESLRRLIPQIPANRLVVETDAPYLTPEPERRRHRRNEPAFVRSVLIKIAEVRGEDPDELARTVFDNTCRLYRIEALV